MIDTDLIMNKEDYLKNDLINTLRDKINSVNKNNIDNSILEIQNILKEFNILNENNICLEKNILNEKSIEMLINSIINTSHYNFENTSFNALKDFIKDSLITIYPSVYNKTDKYRGDEYNLYLYIPEECTVKVLDFDQANIWRDNWDWHFGEPYKND